MSKATLEPVKKTSDARALADFLQIHSLTSYPASNPNRDRDGEPKRIIYGNVERGRISSQCLKRTIRTGRLFNHAFGDLGDDQLGIRTKELGGIVYELLITGGVEPAAAEQWTLILAAVFGPTKPKKKETMDHLKNETMFLVSPAEKQALLAYAATIAASKLAPPAIKGKEEMEKEAKKLRPEILKETSTAVDIALFGRMFAQDKSFSVEACCQVAHAFTVHSMEVEDDFFTAVDDMKESGESEGEDRGGGHLGELGLGAGLFYNYAVINLTALREALGNDIAREAARTFVEAFLTEFPRAKGNSCAQQSRAFYGRVERGSKVPRNLALAFLDPLDRKGVSKTAIDRLKETSQNIDKVYGNCVDRMKEFDVFGGGGEIAELLDLASAK
jgi:CRISPR system Cascade subunit CasC